MTMRDAHFEIVRAADVPNPARNGDLRPPHQPFHARVRAGNVKMTWSTETYVEKDGARGAIGQFVSMLSPVHKASVYADRVEMWLDEQELGAKHSVPIVEVDLRDQEEITRYDQGHAVGGAVQQDGE